MLQEPLAKPLSQGPTPRMRSQWMGLTAVGVTITIVTARHRAMIQRVDTLVIGGKRRRDNSVSLQQMLPSCRRIDPCSHLAVAAETPVSADIIDILWDPC